MPKGKTLTNTYCITLLFLSDFTEGKLRYINNNQYSVDVQSEQQKCRPLYSNYYLIKPTSVKYLTEPS